MSLVRLYRVRPLEGLCLLAVGDGRIVVERVLQLNPLVAALEGAAAVMRLAILRDALANGYILTNHDPDDGFFREAEIVSLDDVLKEVGDVTHEGGS